MDFFCIPLRTAGSLLWILPCIHPVSYTHLDVYKRQLYDVVRIDHFRGFDEYFSIPYGDTTAWNGHWEKGPGMEIFNKMK